MRDKSREPGGSQENHKNVAPHSYSYRKATIGSTRIARRAGM
jgi:hypothetical protein